MFDTLLNSYSNTPHIQIVLELICFVLGILSVWYARKENILVYPTGLISTAITVYLLYLTNDIGNMLVNAYFSLMSIFGWYNWKFGRSEGQAELVVSRTNLYQKGFGVLIGLVTFIMIYYIYDFFSITIDALTYIDLLTTAIFFTAMWYMALKKLESWTLWTIGNLIVIPLFVYRNLLLLSLQYTILTFLAISAYFEWKKSLKK
jgi:nicotinamide mononucleotide transporter